MQCSVLLIAMLVAVVQPQNPTGRVHDLAGLLSPEDRETLENLARDAERKTTAQLMVVTVPSLDGQTVEAYAHELFNAWGIGQRDVNNGVLFLIAPKERRMRFEVGYGLEPLLTDDVCGTIRDAHVIPRFKEGNFAAGIMAGTRRLAEILESNPVAARGVRGSSPQLARTARNNALVATSAVGLIALALCIVGVLFATSRLYSTTAFVLATLIGLVVLAVAVYFIWKTPKTQQPLAWFGGAGAASLAAWFYNLRKYRRFGPHGCSKCGTQFVLLSEQTEDPKLTPVQQLEEQIGSVDYDVWFCPACLNVKTERYIKPFSKFNECSACQARTFKEDPPVVVRPATTSTQGRQRIDGRCVSCNHKTVRNIILPVISSSVVGGSSSGGSSFGGGGGGGGGGSSGGGGASGGW